METEAVQQRPDTQQRLKSLRARHSTLADRVEGGELSLDEAIAIAEERNSKPRSGYARKKREMVRLYAERDQLQAEYDALQADHAVLLAELQRKDEELKRKDEEVQALRSMHKAMESDVAMVLAENQRLVDAMTVLRSTFQPQPTPQPQQPYRQPTPPGLPSLFSRGYR